MKLSTRIVGGYLIVFAVIFAIVFAITGPITINVIRQQTYAYIVSSNRTRAEHVRTFIQDQEKTAVILAAASVYRDFLRTPATSDQYAIVKAKIDARLQRTLAADPLIVSTSILDVHGMTIATSDPNEIGKDESQDDYFIQGMKDVFFKDVYLTAEGALSYVITAPIFDDAGIALGVSVLRYKPERFFSIFSNENELGPTEENFLINNGHYFITPSRFLSESVILKQQVKTPNANHCFAPAEIAYVNQNGYQGNEHIGHPAITQAPDYRNTPTVSTHAYIPETGWCLITKIDESHIIQHSRLITAINLGVGLPGFFLFILFGYFLSRQITKPILKLQKGAQEIEKGDWNYKVATTTKDEIGALSRAFDKTTAKLKESYANVDRKVKEQTKTLVAQRDKLEFQKTAMLNVLEDIKAEKDKASRAATDMRKFMLAVENASDQVVITDPDGIVLYANKVMETITGYTRKEALGKKAGKLWSMPMSQAYYKNLWETIKTKKRVFTSIIRNKRKNGEFYDADISISPILDERGNVQYFVAIERDVTEKQKSIENAERLASIVRTTDDAIIGKLLDGTITSWNFGAQKLYGYTEKEILGKNIATIVPPDRTDELDRIMSQVTKGEIIEHLQTVRKKKDGSLVDVSITSSPLKDAKGKIVGASTIARDITKEIAVDRAKTEFVSLASHQLRTPLSAINWFTEMLMSGDAGRVNTQQKEYLREVYNGSQRMVALVNALLNVSRIDMGTFAIEPRPTKIQDIAGIAIKDLKQQLKEKHISLVKDISSNIPVISLDPNLVLIILQNLLSNAVKYTPNKGMVTLRIVRNLKVLSIEVQDTGYGIAEQDKEKIFQKLFRADNVRERVPDGTGLGLYVVKSIIERCGGSISFTSKLGKGSTFRAILPATGMKPKTGTKGLTS